MNPQYLETFKNKVSVIESYVWVILNDPGLAKEKLSVVVNPSYQCRKAEAKSEKNKYPGVTIIFGANRMRYRNMVEELQNDFTKLNDSFPANTKESNKLLVNYKTPYKPQTILIDNSYGVLFTNVVGSKRNYN